MSRYIRLHCNTELTLGAREKARAASRESRVTHRLNMEKFLILFLASCSCVFGHKILLHPYSCGGNSHLMGLLCMADVLKEAGHEVHFLVSSEVEPQVRKAGHTEGLHVFPSPLGGSHLSDQWANVLLTSGDAASWNFLSALSVSIAQHSEALVSNRQLLEELQQSKFDVYIYDIMELSGPLVSSVLDAKVIIYGATSYITTDISHFPNMPAFIPSSLSPFSDEMTFFERLQNVLYDLILDYTTKYMLEAPTAELAKSYNLSSDFQIGAKVMNFVRANFALDFSRPLMPNVINIGGAMMSASKPLEGELKTVADSAEEGLILMSLGSMIDTIPAQYLQVFLTVLGKLRQTVILRHTGNDLSFQIPSNVFLYGWLPQNDLLGHANMKLFITHCGIASMYEAVYHAVPVVALPVFGDQFLNAQKLVSKVRMGTMVHFHSASENSLYDAIQDVLANASYKQNALKANRTMFDQPVPPREKLLFYVDYTARHDGIEHLTQESLWRLNGAQLMNLDVYAFLVLIVLISLAISGLTLYIIVKLCKKMSYRSKEHMA